MSKYISSFLLLLIVSSCGLNYVAPPTPISLTGDRKKAIQSYLKETLEKDSSVYADIAWGKSKTIKPTSYMALDSLYGLKYNLERQGRKDSELEDVIQIQRLVALNDTASILYQEDHLFSITKGNQMTVYSSIFECDQNHQIRNSTINGSNKIDPKRIEEFKIYTFEESFINPGYMPMDSEKQFFLRYKNHSNELTGDKKDEFINHTLKMMNLIRRTKSFDTKALLVQVVQEEIHGSSTFIPTDQLYESMEEIVDTSNGVENITGYQVVYSFKQNQNGLVTSLRYIVQTDIYFQVTAKSLI